MKTTRLLLPLFFICATMCVSVAHATNERSYKRGYWLGFNDYSCIRAADGQDCDGPYTHEMSQFCVLVNANYADTIFAGITNSTAWVGTWMVGLIGARQTQRIMILYHNLTSDLFGYSHRHTKIWCA